MSSEDRVTPAAVEQETVTVFAKPLPVAEVLREARLMVGKKPAS
jgi:hypothetical protein